MSNILSACKTLCSEWNAFKKRFTQNKSIMCTKNTTQQLLCNETSYHGEMGNDTQSVSGLLWSFILAAVTAENSHTWYFFFPETATGQHCFKHQHGKESKCVNQAILGQA